MNKVIKMHFLQSFENSFKNQNCFFFLNPFILFNQLIEISTWDILLNQYNLVLILKNFVQPGNIRMVYLFKSLTFIFYHLSKLIFTVAIFKSFFVISFCSKIFSSLFVFYFKNSCKTSTSKLFLLLIMKQKVSRNGKLFQIVIQF